MDDLDRALMESLPPGSTFIRPENDPSLTTGRDDRGWYVCDPRTGHRLYKNHTGHSDPRGQFLVRDASGGVVVGGKYRTDRAVRGSPPWGALFYRIQSLYAPGWTHFLDPDIHGLGKIPNMIFAYMDMHYRGPPRSRDVLFVDERKHWFRKHQV